MKKLIVLSVVFALVATAAFAVDLGGTVIGTVNLFNGESGDGANEDILGNGGMNRIRIDGSGEAGEGKFGGYFRFGGGDPSGNAWWKPIDQFKLIIGSNGGDGFYGKEGNAGWMFYQAVTDTGVAMGGGNVWGGGYGTTKVRDAFFGGDGGNDALRLEITPMDILGINIKLPFIDTPIVDGVDGKVEDIFKAAIVQLDLKLDFGNIALTYYGGTDAADPTGNFSGYAGDWSNSKLFVYYGGSFGDLSIDFGFGYHFDKGEGDSKAKQPMRIGLGLKYATDAFGVKFRAVASLAGDDKNTEVIAEALPYFSLGDNISAFVSVGLGMSMPDQGANAGETLIGWHFNPYVQIGEDWGAKFLVGVKVWNNTAFADATTGWNNVEDNLIHWSVPIAISVSF